MKNKTKHPKINRPSGVIILNIELLGSSVNFISLISKNFFDTVSTFIVITSISIFSVV